MNEENKKVVSIRLIYIVLILAVIIGSSVYGVKYINEQKTIRLAKSFVIEQEKPKLEISNVRLARAINVSARSEVISRVKQDTESTADNNIENVGNYNVLEEKENTIEKNESNQENKAKDNEQEENRAKQNYITISEVKISQGMDLTVRTGLSREDFITLISGVKADTSGFFEQNAGMIYDLCEEYSINEIFFCGLISAESGWNIAQNHRNTRNYISLMSNGKLINYSSVEEGLRVAAQKLHYNYLTPGGKFYYGKTLSAVKTKFCPSSSWVGLVYGRMQQILK